MPQCGLDEAAIAALDDPLLITLAESLDLIGGDTGIVGDCNLAGFPSDRSVAS